jgi:O-antigen/teichoic acid export membrane protein
LSILKKYSHINWALADQAMVSGTNFLTGVLFARFLGVAEFGRFTLAWMVVQFVASLQMAMISSPMMSIAPKQSAEDRPYYYGSVLAQQIIFAVISSCLVWLCVRLSQYIYPTWQIHELATPLAIAVFCFQSQDFLRRWFFSQGRPAAAFVNDAVSYLGQLAVLFYYYHLTTLDTTKVLYINAVTSALAFYGFFILGKLAYSTKSLIVYSQRNWAVSKWLVASSILQWTSGNLFLIASGTLLNTTAVGALKAAQNIVGITHILFQGLENIIPIRISHSLNQTGICGMRAYLKKVSLFGGFATLSILAPIIIMPEFLLKMVYGFEYIEYGFVVVCYGVIYLAIFFSLPLRAALRALEYSKPIFVAYVISTLFSVFTVKPLLTAFAIKGALIGIAGTSSVLLAVLFTLYQIKVNSLKA